MSAFMKVSQTKGHIAYMSISPNWLATVSGLDSATLWRLAFSNGNGPRILRGTLK